MKNKRVRTIFDKAEKALESASNGSMDAPTRMAQAVAGLGLAILAAIAKDMRDFDEVDQ